MHKKSNLESCGKLLVNQPKNMHFIEISDIYVQFIETNLHLSIVKENKKLAVKLMLSYCSNFPTD